MTVLAVATTAYLRIADDPPVDVDPSTGKGPEWGKASPVGLLVILLLGIATFFLLRSMTRRLKRVQNGLGQPPAAALTTVPASAVPSEAPADAAAAPEATERSDSPPG